MPRPRASSEPLPVVDWIAAKRDGHSLSDADVRRLIDAFMRGNVADYQMSAFLMATLLRGMSDEETMALTRAMLESGKRLRGRRGGRPRIDKHSTGGVGDKISICLAPLVAACGVDVPMISGRGLGHTGGTLDKLEAIPGYDTQLDPGRFQAVVARAGASIIGQTRELAPADQRIYALRDVTATVPSEPLIVASILSKKLAAGLDGLVMDVKVGRGAFMKDRRSARRLARLLGRVGAGLGTPVRCVLTDMSTPIGTMIGNSLETAEAISVLRGEGPEDTKELTLELGVEMLCLAGVERSRLPARRRLERALSQGMGARRLEQMIALQGGDARVVAEPWRLPRARARVAVAAPRAGYVTDVDALALATIASRMGAGRQKVTDRIDPRCGIELCVARGSRVAAGEPLALLHGGRASARQGLLASACAAFRIGATRPRARPRIIERLPVVPAQKPPPTT